MSKENETEIDYEKLRKALVAREFVRTSIVMTHANAATTSNIYEASPEQLINYARRSGVNIEKYRIKKDKK